MQKHPNHTKIRVLPDAAAVSGAAAAMIMDLISERPDATLGLATGETPRALYQQLRRAYAAGEVSFAQAHTFNLDEYCGLDASHPDSYASYMRRELFEGTDFRAENINLIRGDAENPDEEARRYSRTLRASGGVDLQILGIGRNGHIGFNEPGSDRESGTRVVELAPMTLKANLSSISELEAVPHRAITIGIADILLAKSIVVLATGRAKADAVRQAITGPEGSHCPASYLARHPGVTWLLDVASASALEPAPHALLIP